MKVAPARPQLPLEEPGDLGDLEVVHVVAVRHQQLLERQSLLPETLLDRHDQHDDVDRLEGEVVHERGVGADPAGETGVPVPGHLLEDLHHSVQDRSRLVAGGAR
ncbi:MAG: hypothetical protein AUH92_01430 [Acidobacteria bacterium 13_1_40CM_4_69_4]|nr:MAG: hypothetical protein AUH92_01430 [Acidobacteria bacterium 13_1_40CM_4_69_4]